jgi:hypothetical protein
MFKSALAVFATALMAMAVVPTAVEATAYASSTLQVSNMVFTGPGFLSFNFRENQTSATVNGITQQNAGPLVGGSGASLNQTPSCVGASCLIYADNSWFPSVGVNNALGNYATADSHMLDTRIHAPVPGSGGFFGSNAQAQLVSPIFATAQTGTDNSMAWTFTVGAGGADIRLVFDLQQNFHLHTDATGESALGTNNIRVAINSTAATQVLFEDRHSDSINESDGAQDIHPLNDVSTHINTGLVHLAGGNYTLRITFDTSADVTQNNRRVPEPASFSLLGVGLVGATYFVRRRRP